MISRFSRAACAAVLVLALTSCQPPDRDIVVVWRNGHLVVDFPWSLWRLVGLQDRTYCIRRVELFDPTKLLWTLDMKGDGRVYNSCLDVRMPLRVSRPMVGFISKGHPVLRTGVTYGIAIDGIGNGRVDFTFRREASPKNVTDRKTQMEPPCGSYLGECRDQNRPSNG
jgi:hypothetical protein